ncbi:ABC transporter ATP-binding protein [Candidatus Kuenenbacteria bacterium CG23_combo_of_CG06-09_8_20_14_all_36_9]|nr:MAG: ABC transporter ATP-binding protein [Candidatus Kuenenbacteria bacterium CG23_combo_of_CG06-09_8_20_14_all_36_9]
MLQITNLKAGYKQMEVLKGLDFEVGKKEIVAVIGPNGSGKSTLLKSIFNLCEIYGGSIKFDGSELVGLPTYKLISLGISYVPQGRQIFSNLTVRENLEVLSFSQKNIPAKQIDKVYNFFPFLKNKENVLAQNLSGGQQQMLALARILIIKPKLLLLDEPSLGLSPKTTKEGFEKIKEINSSGIAVIIVEQNAKLAVEIANRTYVLEDGQIALIGGKEILNNEKIKDIYFGGR